VSLAAWLLAPVALALSPLYVAVCLVFRVDGLALLAAGWRLLSGLRSTRVEVLTPDASVVVRFV
jgi:hypothetical protein